MTEYTLFFYGSDNRVWNESQNDHNRFFGHTLGTKFGSKTSSWYHFSIFQYFNIYSSDQFLCQFLLCFCRIFCINFHSNNRIWFLSKATRWWTKRLDISKSLLWIIKSLFWYCEMFNQLSFCTHNRQNLLTFFSFFLMVSSTQITPFVRLELGQRVTTDTITTTMKMWDLHLVIRGVTFPTHNSF